MGSSERSREANSKPRVWGLGNLSGKVEMDMFGGLTKTSSRIAIAAALGLTLGGFAFKATPAQAADLGGDCCADLEERVAELEATTVRKGNKKVSVTLSGWVVKSMNWWDDGDDRQLRRRRQGLRLGEPLRHHRQRDDRAWLVGRFQHHRRHPGMSSSATADQLAASPQSVIGRVRSAASSTTASSTRSIPTSTSRATRGAP